MDGMARLGGGSSATEVECLDDRELDGAERFGEIRSPVPGLTGRLLAQRLREREGVVECAYASATLVPHYTLRAKGHPLAP